MNRIPKAVYTREFREEALKLALTEGVGVSEAARRLSVALKTLANGVRSAKAGKLQKVGRDQKPLTDNSTLYPRKSFVAVLASLLPAKS